MTNDQAPESDPLDPLEAQIAEMTQSVIGLSQAGRDALATGDRLAFAVAIKAAAADVVRQGELVSRWADALIDRFGS